MTHFDSANRSGHRVLDSTTTIVADFLDAVNSLTFRQFDFIWLPQRYANFRLDAQLPHKTPRRRRFPMATYAPPKRYDNDCPKARRHLRVCLPARAHRRAKRDETFHTLRVTCILTLSPKLSQLQVECFGLLLCVLLRPNSGW